jgi:hypothetical protein
LSQIFPFMDASTIEDTFKECDNSLPKAFEKIFTENLASEQNFLGSGLPTNQRK